jgi:hypothetical protein
MFTRREFLRVASAIPRMVIAIGSLPTPARHKSALESGVDLRQAPTMGMGDYAPSEFLSPVFIMADGT